MENTKLAGTVLTWEHDPGFDNNFDGGRLIEVPVPPGFPVTLSNRIQGETPAPSKYETGSPEFRYWVAAEALQRGASFWVNFLKNITWVTGNELPVVLDGGEALNAYYDRQALRFYHGSAGNRIIYSGESPDILCHEQGHAVLDAIKPELWDVAGIEADSFHEAFGDMSAILCALQLQSLRTGLLEETNGSLYTSSRLSKLAEQLACAIRYHSAAAVDPDCLRNAVNSFYYQDPYLLPAIGPASSLSSEPHSFSRVFTSAFFEGLGKMFSLQNNQDESSLLLLSRQMGQILVNAVRSADIVPRFYRELAIKMMIEARIIDPAYPEALRLAFQKHGLLEPADTLSIKTLLSNNLAFSSLVNPDPAAPMPLTLSVEEYNLGVNKIIVMAPNPESRLITPWSDLKFASVTNGPVQSNDLSSESAARIFLENLLRRGRLRMVSTPDSNQELKQITEESVTIDKHTHELRLEDGKRVLRRIKID
ncbi:MAG: hypothetical protein ABWZ25_11240 [Chitinophagaceae bacterium]